MEPRIKYAKTEDGVSIAYYAIGDGPPLRRPPDQPRADGNRRAPSMPSPN